MAEYIENRPVACNTCNNYPVMGQESTIETQRQIITECRWVCPRCGSLVRVDERVQEKSNNAQ